MLAAQSVPFARDARNGTAAASTVAATFLSFSILNHARRATWDVSKAAW